MKHAVIHIRTEEPDYSDIPVKEYDWFYTCYNGAKEEIPKDAPLPLGKPVKTMSYMDANLYHDLISGKSVTGILHLFNKILIHTFSKLQSTVETATLDRNMLQQGPALSRSLTCGSCSDTWVCPYMGPL